MIVVVKKMTKYIKPASKLKYNQDFLKRAPTAIAFKPANKAPTPIAFKPSKPYFKLLLEAEKYQKEEARTFQEKWNKRHEEKALDLLKTFAQFLKPEDLRTSTGYLFKHYQMEYAAMVWEAYGCPLYFKLKRTTSRLPYSFEIVVSKTDPTKATFFILYRRNDLNPNGDPVLYSSKDPKKPGGIIASGAYGNVRMAQAIPMYKDSLYGWSIDRQQPGLFRARKVPKNAKINLSIEYELYLKSQTYIEKDMKLYDKNRNQTVLITPLLPGTDLVDFLIAEENPITAAKILSLYEKLAIIVHVFKKLEFLAKIGIVHRDVKPENIRVWFEDETNIRVWLLDYGLSVNAGEFHQPGGTREYVPLEMGGDRISRVNHIQDVYALIQTLYECFEFTPEFIAIKKGLSVAEPYQKLYNFCRNNINYQRLSIKFNLLNNSEKFVSDFTNTLIKISNELIAMDNAKGIKENTSNTSEVNKENALQVTTGKQEPSQSQSNAPPTPLLRAKLSALIIN